MPGKTYRGHKLIALVAVGCRATVCVATKVKQLKSKTSRHPHVQLRVRALQVRWTNAVQRSRNR